MFRALKLKWITWGDLAPFRYSLSSISWNFLWSFCIPNLKWLWLPATKIWKATQNVTSTSVFGDCRISTHADPTSTRRANLIGTWLRYVFPFWTSHLGGWPICLILGFWRSTVPQNGRFSAKDDHKPLCKIWRR